MGNSAHGPWIRLTEAELDAIVERAAIAGGKSVLKSIGLDYEDAYVDMHELKGLLRAWRNAKATAWQTLVRLVITAFLAAIVTTFAVEKIK